MLILPLIVLAILFFAVYLKRASFMPLKPEDYEMENVAKSFMNKRIPDRRIKEIIGRLPLHDKSTYAEVWKLVVTYRRDLMGFLQEYEPPY